MRRALPLDPGSSGEFQSRSVGPLPATITTAGNGPGPAGLTSVPYMVVASSGHVISTLSAVASRSAMLFALLLPSPQLELTRVDPHRLASREACAIHRVA